MPEGAAVPAKMDSSVTVLQQPLDKIYLAATSAMSLFAAVDALDHIRLTGTRESGWYIDAAVEAMQRGDIEFAGKYSEPDYERLIDEECNLAIESTMIYHTPKVKEMIEDLGIPVLVDRSSYEQHPLGRTEWIKLYAALVGKDAEAAEFFDQQAAIITQLEGFENTGKTVAFFFVNSDGSIVIRKPTDYIPKMIELAGGRYAFENFVTDQTNTSVSVTMETFYGTAVDADVLIYNASIDAPISSINELLAKDALFADFKAVQEGNVWCTGKSFYQATDIVGEMIRDIHLALTGGDGERHDVPDPRFLKTMTEKTVNTNTAPAQAGAYLVHQARRRARYALVFFVLIAGLLPHHGAEHQHRQHPHPARADRGDPVHQDRQSHGGKYHLEDPPAAHPHGGDPRRSALARGLSAADVL